MMSASTVHMSKKLCKDMTEYQRGISNGTINPKDPVKIQTCNSKRPIHFYVADKETLRKINRRYYYDDISMGKMKCVNYKTDSFLIGQWIWMRSPVTCTCEDGICAACYGDLSYTNCEEEFNIGAYASAKCNNTLQQNILSTKHLLTTNSEEIVFSKDFYRFFILDASKFKLDPDSSENFDNWVIRILNDDLYEFNAKEENDFNSCTERFFLFNKKTKENIEIKELNRNQLMYMYDDVLKLFAKSKEFDGIEMPLNKIADDDTYFAIIVIENNELTRPLKNIMRLLDRKDHYGCKNIDDLVNTMCALLVECGHPLDMVHAECIIRTIIKDSENVLIPPHFEDVNRLEDYQILTISAALLNNPSLTVSLSFQDLGKQVTNPNTNIKCEKSSYDDLYMENLKPPKKHKKIKPYYMTFG